MFDNHQNLINVIRIINTVGVGSVTFFKLLNLYHSTEEILKALPNVLKSDTVIPSIDFAEKEIESAYNDGIDIILWDSEMYPDQLKNIYSKPVVLYAKGNVDLLRNKSVAIVGTRNPTIVGKNFVHNLSNDLVNNNFTIISGMAIGIDTYAHKGAINDRFANTIAVLAGSVNDIYPPSNRLLYNEIINKNGLIISDKPLNYVAKATDFPRRNRIIAGLSVALIVSEATSRSGSLITAKYAIDQKKLIYCIPSHPSDARSYGPNKLISNGAKIFVSLEKLIFDLNNISFVNHNFPTDLFFYDNIKDTYINKYADKESMLSNDIIKYIFSVISYNSVCMEDLFQDINNKYELSISEFSKLILQMELDGLIVNLNGQISKR